MRTPLRVGERQSSTASSGLSHTLAYAAVGGALGGVALLLWLELGWWVLLFVACVFASASFAKVLARFELKRMTRELEYQRRTPYEAGVGQQLDVEA
ncbi:MAG: hypothetical protein NCW75_05650 [Phycisphaera sp.]|nr:MAG: hypothetical protein NCW75_05650 [Phycisphaera sp.]